MSTSLSKAERADMFRNFAGVLTALIHQDRQAVDRQLSAIMQEQFAAAGGDVNLFAKRMARQIEAGAGVTHGILKSLAPRVGMTEGELHELIASNLVDIESMLPE